jgi:hypothetical protein
MLTGILFLLPIWGTDLRCVNDMEFILANESYCNSFINYHDPIADTESPVYPNNPTEAEWACYQELDKIEGLYWQCNAERAQAEEKASHWKREYRKLRDSKRR